MFVVLQELVSVLVFVLGFVLELDLVHRPWVQCLFLHSLLMGFLLCLLVLEQALLFLWADHQLLDLVHQVDLHFQLIGLLGLLGLLVPLAHLCHLGQDLLLWLQVQEPCLCPQVQEPCLFHQVQEHLFLLVLD